MRGTRIFAILAAVGLAALAADPARALGLGEARVDSYLNQPLDVRIRLLDASEADLDSLTVDTASAEDYQRLGLTASALALGLELEVDRSRSPAVVRVRSTRPVSDPIVQMLVDARWSSGRMLREYTLFLDPPVLDIAPPPSTRSEPARAAEPASRPAETATRPSTSSRPAQSDRRAAQETPRAVRSGGGQRLVRSGDTLWSIARSNLPADDVTMNQMMVAIVELNPQAFRNGNIHQMLRGSELTLPTADEVRQVDAASARATVQTQNRMFNQRLAGDVPVISDAARGGDADPDRSEPAARPEPEEPRDPRPAATTPTASREPEPEGRLELVPAGEDASGTGMEDDEAEVAQLREQLARTEEELYAARLEAEDFRARLDDLETLVENNPGGAGISDAELAGLEQTLRAARLAAEEDADPAMRAEVTAQLDDYLDRFEAASMDDVDPEAGPSIDDGAIDDAGDLAADDSTAATGESEDRPGEPAEETPSEPVVTQVGGSRDGILSRPLFWPIAGLVALLIAIGGFWVALQRRRREAEDASAVAGVVRGTGPARGAVPPAASDPVDRARAAVAERPDDLAAHLALLQALAGRGEKQAFEDALEHMFEHVDSGEEPAWREAVELAATVSPEHVLVKGSADWMSASVDSSAEPKSEIDEESEVGDLMSRLDAEQDEESDDSEWLIDEDDEAAETDAGPMLRDSADEEDEPLVLGGKDPDHDDLDSKVEPTGADEPAIGMLGDASTPDVPDEEDEAEWLDDDLAGDAERDDATRRIGDQTEAAGDAGVAADDDASLGDWTSEGEGGDVADGGDDSAEADGDDDIFAPSDDDVDVKLDLARAYLSWNSTDSAKTLLEEVVREGNPEQKEQAQKLLDDL
ncbi:FimV/HubP family polar landmark protein [Halomonas denitrificans]|nr:hypothetical protein [Halomonas denitrificans]